MEKDKALFVAYFFWSGHNTQSVWQQFDKVFSLAEEFVTTYSQDDNWEEDSFEEFMEEFIIKNLDKCL